MFLDELFEARQKHPDINYVEKKTKGIVDRVIAVLTGNKSGAWTRIAQRYERLDRLQKLLKKERDKLNLDVKDKIDVLFDAEDALLTRVIETAQLTISLSKATTANDVYFDIEGYVEELETLVPHLEDQLKVLREKYTTVEEIVKSPALRVRLHPKKPEVRESDEDSIFDKFNTFIKKSAKLVYLRLADYDKALDTLKAKMQKDGIIA